jgi:peptide deformylase
MQSLHIVRIGHPALRKKSSRVSKSELKNETFQQFLDSLIAICDKNSGVGIAAPQVGVNKRVIVVHVDPKNPRYKNKKLFPSTVIINPKVMSKSKKLREDWEGDLSCNLRALVPRPVTCSVLGLDRLGNTVVYNLTYDFHARVFQHEIDHLNGIFLLDRVKNKQSICELDEWKKYWKNK